MGLIYVPRKAQDGWVVVATSDRNGGDVSVVAKYPGNGMSAAEYRARETAKAMQDLYDKQVAGL